MALNRSAEITVLSHVLSSCPRALWWADVCTALQLKQARYPVCYLTCAGDPAIYSDSRNQTLDNVSRTEIAAELRLCDVLGQTQDLLCLRV